LLNSQQKLLSTKHRRIWWHAASVGELEILWPVILRVAEESGSSFEFIVTVLSESAKERLEKLVAALKKLGVTVVFGGYSPWEGDWSQALQSLQPDLFITSKYEAWPDLWMELQAMEVPLFIVSAKDRRSLRICRGICRVLGAHLPQMSLFTAIPEDVLALKQAFPDAQVEMMGEPRWDQVWNRAQIGNLRAKELAAAIGNLPKPWGVLGSAWDEDVALWSKNLKKIASASDQDGLGSVLIVPHRIDQEYLSAIEEVLDQAGVEFLKTAEFKSVEEFKTALSAKPRLRCLLINEMGFLSELYSVADWVYVGGGIGKRGVHSTIEPAIHGMPISCGTYRAHQFVEISELASTGQLTLVRTEEDLERWLSGLRTSTQRERWRLEAKRRLGATERISQRILGMLH
jgi:3-deoxy-D-manno-octulosonic-acid transferase